MVCKMEFNALPEGCIANILSLTTPCDVCRISLVSSTFRSAANSDQVWGRFLPSDYRSIISRSADPLRRFATKKELYFSLCNDPLIIDDGLKMFSLEKRSGKKCFMLAAKSLQIASGGDTSVFWHWPSFSGSRFDEVVEFLRVCWLDICGKISVRMLSPATSYVAYLVFRLIPEHYGFDHHPAAISIGLVGGECSRNTVCLCTDDYDTVRENSFGMVTRSRMAGVRRPKQRKDGWLVVELGVFFNTDGEDGELEMIFKELGGNWKSGLVVEGIELRPTEV